MNLAQIDPIHTHGGIPDRAITNQPESISNITIDPSSPNVSDHDMSLFDVTIDEIILSTGKPT